jgi:hypothetical protein
MPINHGYLPDRIVAGETIWLAAANTAQSQSDIIIDGFTPAAGYTLAYQFAAATPVSVSAVANGANTGWTLELTGAQTLLWTPGKMYFAGIVSLVDAGPPQVTRTFAVDQGAITVDASPMRVSSWVAVLASIDAAIAAYAANPNGSLSIEGMSVTYRSLSQLTDLRDYATYRLQQDSAKRPRRIIRTEFTTI